MLRAAIAFFILAILAYALGSSGIAGMSVEIGRVLLTVFLIVAVISLLVGLTTSKDGKLLK